MNDQPILPSLIMLHAALYMRAPDEPATNHRRLVNSVPQIVLDDAAHERPCTATFSLVTSDGSGDQIEEMTLHWPMPEGVCLSNDEFISHCFAQAESFNAQLLAANRGVRVWAIKMVRRKNPDTLDYTRHMVGLSAFETFAWGGRLTARGILVTLEKQRSLKLS